MNARKELKQIPNPEVPPASSTPIIFGVVLAVLGQFIYGNGQRAAIEAAFSRFADDGSNAMLIGSLMTLAGLIVGLVGVARLCRRIDYLSWHAGNGR